MLKIFIAISLLFTLNIDAKEANLEHLKQYIGTYSIEKILNDKVVSKKLKLLLGSSMDKLKENLTVRNPIDMISKGIVMSGIAPHQGGYEMAIVHINLQNQKVTAAIYSNNTIKIYSDEKNYMYLPQSITSTITLWNTEFSVLVNKPDNVIMMHLN